MLSSGERAVAVLALGVVTAAGMAGQQGTAESDLGARLLREQERTALAQMLDQWKRRHPSPLWDEVRVAYSGNAGLQDVQVKQMFETA